MHCNQKKFNNKTYKTHSLGHYPWAVQYWGATDVFSTQAGEREHMHVKHLYHVTNKQHVEEQIGTHVMCQVRMKQAEEYQREQKEGVVEPVDYEEMPAIDPDKHHQISSSQKDPINPYYWTKTNNTDPSLMNFKQDLQAHLLQCLHGSPSDMQYEPQHLCLASIANNKIYEHKTMQLYYSTYDLW
ncbi:hypothetical protein Moror_15344 [Moniliophthora roreri MCA 2997]|uniref:Uncharacterized protein n=1 Tax=Moniliophthora roreri (strain MCA 2997) TaxID=1381753 RepID=V2Y803_MONRO|nr:hypothetical protein Moror_15344 [Moniliophthora roreri MCA 2997]